MSKEQHLIIIPGLGDTTRTLKWITRNWRKKYGSVPHVVAFGWEEESSLFDAHFEKIGNHISGLLKKGCDVSLLGISAGGSAVFNLYYRFPEVSHVINICGRLREGVNTHPSLDQAAKHNPIFKESVLRCEKGMPAVTKFDRKKILTVRPLWDEVVPVSTMIVEGATNKQIVSAEHIASIFIAMTLYTRTIVDFIKQEAV